MNPKEALASAAMYPDRFKGQLDVSKRYEHERYSSRLALAPLRVQAKARYFGFHEGAVNRGLPYTLAATDPVTQ